MRIRTVVGIAVAGGAAAVVAGIGGTALAAEPQRAEPTVSVVVDGSDQSAAGAVPGWDCPEMDGAAEETL